MNEKVISKENEMVKQLGCERDNASFMIEVEG
jgi:hypothetical protein